MQQAVWIVFSRSQHLTRGTGPTRWAEPNWARRSAGVNLPGGVGTTCQRERKGTDVWKPNNSVYCSNPCPAGLNALPKATQTVGIRAGRRTQAFWPAGHCPRPHPHWKPGKPPSLISRGLLPQGDPGRSSCSSSLRTNPH